MYIRPFAFSSAHSLGITKPSRYTLRYIYFSTCTYGAYLSPPCVGMPRYALSLDRQTDVCCLQPALHTQTVTDSELAQQGSAPTLKDQSYEVRALASYQTVLHAIHQQTVSQLFAVSYTCYGHALTDSCLLSHPDESILKLVAAAVWPHFHIRVIACTRALRILHALKACLRHYQSLC